VFNSRLSPVFFGWSGPVFCSRQSPVFFGWGRGICFYFTSVYVIVAHWCTWFLGGDVLVFSASTFVKFVRHVSEERRSRLTRTSVQALFAEGCA